MLIGTLLIILGLVAVGRPFVSQDISKSWTPKVLDQIETETQRAVNTAYFNSDNIGEELIDYFAFLDNRLRSHSMNIKGSFLILTPDRRWYVGNFFDEEIEGKLVIDSRESDIEVKSFTHQSGSFEEFEQVRFNLTTPEGRINKEFNLSMKLNGKFNIWLENGRNIWHTEIGD